MIGILDWGIGGLGFFKLLRERHPKVPVIYFSDAGTTPYGKVAPARLASRVREVAEVLRGMGAHRLVVACNAASTVLPRLDVHGTSGMLPTSRGPIETTGIIDHAIRMALAANARGASAGGRDLIPRAIGIIGGARTIRSGMYLRALAAPDSRAHRRRLVIQRIAQPLSAFVEAGDVASFRLHRALASLLKPLANVDTLLLACTHYAALMDPLRAHLPRARILDPSAALVDWVVERWQDDMALSGRARFITSGDPASMRHAAASAFGVRLGQIERLGARSIERPT